MWIIGLGSKLSVDMVSEVGHQREEEREIQRHRLITV